MRLGFPRTTKTSALALLKRFQRVSSPTMEVCHLCFCRGRLYMPSWLLYIVFWREDKLRRIIPSLIAQVSVCITGSHYANGTSALSSCLTNLAGCITDDATLKTVNLGVLMHTRSEDSRVRLFALKCGEALWVAHSGRLIGQKSPPVRFWCFI
jgi:hypothetical protein